MALPVEDTEVYGAGALENVNVTNMDGSASEYGMEITRGLAPGMKRPEFADTRKKSIRGGNLDIEPPSDPSLDFPWETKFREQFKDKIPDTKVDELVDYFKKNKYFDESDLVVVGDDELKDDVGLKRLHIKRFREIYSEKKFPLPAKKSCNGTVITVQIHNWNYAPAREYHGRDDQFKDLKDPKVEIAGIERTFSCFRTPHHLVAENILASEFRKIFDQVEEIIENMSTEEQANVSLIIYYGGHGFCKSKHKGVCMTGTDGHYFDLFQEYEKSLTNIPTIILADCCREYLDPADFGLEQFKNINKDIKNYCLWVYSTPKRGKLAKDGFLFTKFVLNMMTVVNDRVRKHGPNKVNFVRVMKWVADHTNGSKEWFNKKKQFNLFLSGCRELDVECKKLEDVIEAEKTDLMKFEVGDRVRVTEAFQTLDSTKTQLMVDEILVVREKNDADYDIRVDSETNPSSHGGLVIQAAQFDNLELVDRNNPVAEETDESDYSDNETDTSESIDEQNEELLYTLGEIVEVTDPIAGWTKATVTNLDPLKVKPSGWKGDFSPSDDEIRKLPVDNNNTISIGKRDPARGNNITYTTTEKPVWMENAGDKPNWPVPYSIELNMKQSYQLEHNGTYIHDPQPFNHDVYVNEKNCLYFYQPKNKKGSWRTAFARPADDLFHIASPNGDGLGAGSQYPSYLDREYGSHYENSRNMTFNFKKETFEESKAIGANYRKLPEYDADWIVVKKFKVTDSEGTEIKLRKDYILMKFKKGYYLLDDDSVPEEYEDEVSGTTKFYIDDEYASRVAPFAG